MKTCAASTLAKVSEYPDINDLSFDSEDHYAALWTPMHLFESKPKNAAQLGGPDLLSDYKYTLCKENASSFGTSFF